MHPDGDISKYLKLDDKFSFQIYLQMYDEHNLNSLIYALLLSGKFFDTIIRLLLET